MIPGVGRQRWENERWKRLKKTYNINPVSFLTSESLGPLVI
jgi:hypothetical protein